jgi:hypothetical protein
MSTKINIILKKNSIAVRLWGTRYRSWLRHYATIRKAVVSIPDEVTIFFLQFTYSFQPHYDPGGFTQPRREMSAKKKVFGIKRGQNVRRTTSCHLLVDCLDNVGASTSHNPMDLHSLL